MKSKHDKSKDKKSKESKPDPYTKAELPETLFDPEHDRAINTVPKPFTGYPSFDRVFPESNKGLPDWRYIMYVLQREGKLDKEQIMHILNQSIDILKKEPNIVKVSFPTTVLGDIHGQFYDLANIMEKKDPKKVSYLCLGDYVDRGSYSIEVLITLLAAKVNYPSKVNLLRGNHESR